MEAVLSDELVTLRAIPIEHAQDLVDGEDEEAVRWLTGGSGTLETASRHILSSREQWQTDGPRKAWGIYDRATGALAGTVEAHLALESLDATEANISYSVFPRFRGRGYAARAVNLVCSWLGDATSKKAAVLRIDPRNVHSARVPRASGFDQEGMVLTPDGDHLMKYVRNLVKPPASAPDLLICP